MLGVQAFSFPNSFFMIPLCHEVLKIYANLYDYSHLETEASVIYNHQFIHKEIDLQRINN